MIEWFICAVFVPAPNFPKLPPPIEIVKQYAVLPKKEDEAEIVRLRPQKKTKEGAFRKEKHQKCSKSEWPMKKQARKPSKAISLYKSEVKIRQKVGAKAKSTKRN